ncbi:hypothetical protein, partial [Roseateles sp. P5_E11]
MPDSNKEISCAQPDQWKAGNEFLPYHPQASHVSPDYRDGWNACYRAAKAAAGPAEPTIQQLAAGAHYPQVYGWTNPAPNAEPVAWPSPSITVQIGAAPIPAPEGAGAIQWLTDVLPPLPGHPEPHTHTWTALEARCIERYGADCARAALAAQPRASHTDFALRALVAAGHITQAKADEALRIAGRVAPAPAEGDGQTDLREAAKQAGVDMDRQDLRDAVWVGYSVGISVAQVQPASYRLDYPTSAAVLGAEQDKAREDQRLFGVGFCVNGWHVPALVVACWGMENERENIKRFEALASQEQPKGTALTSIQIERGREQWGGERHDFTAGVRFAERAHRIGAAQSPAPAPDHVPVSPEREAEIDAKLGLKLLPPIRVDAETYAVIERLSKANG